MDTHNLVSTFIDLVSIDSPSGHEQQIAKFLILKLKKAGADVSQDKSGNILAKISGIGEPVLVSAHMDTVEPGRSIKPKIKGNYITSDGTTVLGADNKAALTAILESIKFTPPTKRRSLEIVFTVREETDGGVKEFKHAQLKSRTGLIADRAAPLGTIVISSPWVSDVLIEITGKAAHAAFPEQGVNVLPAFARLVQSLSLGRIDDQTTFNLGLISGGNATNTIPGSLTLKGEIRSFSPKLLQQQKTRLMQLCKKMEIMHQVKTKVSITPYCSGYKYSEKDKVIRNLSQLHKNLGLKVNLVSSLGASDANEFVKNGIKVVNVGYGAEFTHTFNERILVDDLQKLTRLFTAYISIDKL